MQPGLAVNLSEVRQVGVAREAVRDYQQGEGEQEQHWHAQPQAGDERAADGDQAIAQECG